MTKPTVLMFRQSTPTVMKGVEAAFDVIKLWEQPDPEAWIDANGGSVRGMINSAAVPVTEALLARFPNLEVISNFGVGYDPVDVHACAARGVVVTHTREVLDDEVADTALALMLMAVRELAAAERYVRAGRWEAEGGFPLSRLSLTGRRLGIIGLGRIGKKLAARAEACGMTVAYHGRSKQADQPYDYYDSPKALAEASDVLVNVAPGGPATAKMIDAGVLAALGADGVLVNIGRGSSVDEAALIEALQSGTIAAAGLDVFEKEPHVPAALREMENVVLLPHIGSASVPTRNAMGQLVVDNLVSWFETGEALTPVPESPTKAAAHA